MFCFILIKAIFHSQYKSCFWPFFVFWPFKIPNIFRKLSIVLFLCWVFLYFIFWGLKRWKSNKSITSMKNKTLFYVAEKNVFSGSCPVNHLANPLIYLATPCGWPDPQIGKHCCKRCVFSSGWTLFVFFSNCNHSTLHHLKWASRSPSSFPLYS